MGRSGGSGRRKETGRIRGPLIWSAASHLLAVSSMVVLGGGYPDSPFREAVEVFLVGTREEGEAVAASEVRASSAALRTGPPAAAAPTLPAKKAEAPDAAGGPFGEAAGRKNPDPVDPPYRSGEGPSHAVLPPPAEPGTPGDPRIPPRSGSGSSAVEVAAKDPPFDLPAPSASPPGPGRTGMPAGSGEGTAVLRDRIRSRIVYPEEAVRRGQEGDVLLRIRIGLGGVPGEIRIARSSGVRLLDDAARKGVVRAAPLPGNPGWVEVPVRFRLR